ncbi:hypothetical protein [Providencia hangzhouensis]|uniref:hypothetical protein n=1 Tax=Providencia hangzhouensis TaxID=3031799 RepID=UPI0034DDC0C4
MNTKENYDELLKEHIGHTTLALLTNQDALSTREVGIFTLDDLISIHSHVYFSLSLPWKKNDILKWFGITSSTTLPIDTDELINTIINTGEIMPIPGIMSSNMLKSNLSTYL